ncbi:MAG: amino acid permease, partial [Bdellovibrionales bacterium]|nr:amino acid permease [Bdellovibrionales bacterium]
MTQRNAFGTFNGVYIPSILTILGVIMYLRLGWVVGNVGLTASLLIITMASAITFLTALSIAATATNMRVGAGGAYYMISRSFGIEAGAAVGVPLYLAQALGVSFYVAGFSESLNALFPQLPPVAISVVVLTLLSILSFYSTDVALKIQNFIFLAIALSLASFFLGETPEYGLALGEVPPEVPFWVVFSVFFPAVTGIEAGISMSGDLKDPAKSLPLGTLAAVLTGYVIYVLIAVFLDRFADAETLRSNPMVMQQVALVGGLVVVGIWGATLSSALGALLGAPRTLQALARDSILPRFIGVGHPQTDAPNTATVFTYLVSLAGVLLGDLDAIAPVLSMFFLTSYGMLNLIAGLEGFMGSPSWRPKFRTPWLLSIFG